MLRVIRGIWGLRGSESMIWMLMEKRSPLFNYCLDKKEGILYSCFSEEFVGFVEVVAFCRAFIFMFFKFKN